MILKVAKLGAKQLRMRSRDVDPKAVSRGDYEAFLADLEHTMREYEGTGIAAPQVFTPLRIFLYVDNVDTFVGRAVAIGAKLQQPVDEKRYGDRSGSLEDPFGYTWHVATHRKDVSPGEIRNHPSDITYP